MTALFYLLGASLLAAIWLPQQLPATFVTFRLIPAPAGRPITKAWQPNRSQSYVSAGPRTPNSGRMICDRPCTNFAALPPSARSTPTRAATSRRPTTHPPLCVGCRLRAGMISVLTRIELLRTARQARAIQLTGSRRARKPPVQL